MLAVIPIAAGIGGAVVAHLCAPASVEQLSAKVFAELEDRHGAADGHAYILTKAGVIPCFVIGTDDPAPLPCEIAVAESDYANCRKWEHVEGVTPECDASRKKYEKLRDSFYCGICGPTGPTK